MPNPVRVLRDRNRTMLLTPFIASSRGGLGQCERLGSHALLVTLTGTSWHWPSPSPQRMHTWKRPRRETVMTSGPQAQSSQPGSDSSPTPALASGTHAGNSWGGTRGSTCTLGCCPHPLCQETGDASQSPAQLSLLVSWRLREWRPRGHQKLSQERSNSNYSRSHFS